MSALLVALMLAAAPTASNPEECATAADMMLMSRAMIEESIPEDKIVGVLRRSYNKQAIVIWSEVILAHAKRSVLSAEDEATAFVRHCLANNGQVYKYFGEGV